MGVCVFVDVREPEKKTRAMWFACWMMGSRCEVWEGLLLMVECGEDEGSEGRFKDDGFLW